MKIRKALEDCSHSKRLLRLAIVVLAGVLAGTFRLAIADEPTYLGNLSYPEAGGQMMDPGCIYFDPHYGETLVADVRNNRIAFFDKRGRYTFDFRDPEHLWGALQMAEDSLGRIYVLRTSPRATVSVFEYNGHFLYDLQLKLPQTSQLLNPGGLVIDQNDHLFVLSVMPAHVYSYTTAGDPLADFALFADDSAAQNQPFFGSMALVNGNLIIPVPMYGLVARYGIDGKSHGFFGMAGGGPGELSFPVAAAGGPEGHIFILDKHRHVIHEFDQDGKWLREFGGRGMSPGWFYHPNCLAINGKDSAIVGQTYKGWVQCLALREPQTDEVQSTATNESGK